MTINEPDKVFLTGNFVNYPTSMKEVENETKNLPVSPQS